MVTVSGIMSFDPSPMQNISRSSEYFFESVPDADDSFPRNQQAQNQQEAV